MSNKALAREALSLAASAKSFRLRSRGGQTLLSHLDIEALKAD
jgi:hypothetical protein